MPDWTVVVPVKGTVGAKSRLGAAQGLALAIALDTVEAAISAPGVARVIVVTSTEAAAPFETVGATVVPDTGGGLNGAARLGIAQADGPVAVLLGDLPALRPAELAAALVLAEAHELSMVADADAEGTAFVAALRGASHAPAFGVGSRAAHLVAGYVELDVPAASGLRRDVDTAEQLTELGGRIGPRTAAALSERPGAEGPGA